MLGRAICSALLLLATNVALASMQASLGKEQITHDAPFAPNYDLTSLSTAGFTTLGHPAFPRHSVRIKKSTDFCDDTVNSYTGYIDIEARHLFFYFFESRGEPDKDDVIFWTNGGPGCSSSVGLFMELGPCKTSDGNSTQYHPESWNAHANIFFIDQPIGVGFSYAEYGETVSTTEEAAKDVAAFVAIFFAHFTAFQGRAFHMAGESFAGTYVPVFASAVYDQNARLVELGMEPVNLQSIMIGNGDTDYLTLLKGNYDVVCTPVSLPPVLGIETCVRMKQSLPRCMKMVKDSCYDMYDKISCGAAILFCGDTITGPLYESNLNPYDISKECEGDINETLCYPVIQQVAAYLSLPSVQEKLGVDASVRGTFAPCNMDVNYAFVSNLEGIRPAYDYVAALLERGVRVLIYVGKNDWGCNHVGNEAWTLALEWSGHDAFANEPLRAWNVSGVQAGMTRSAGGLTYASVAGAGHMVPYDKPKESLEMLNRWLNKEAL